MNSRITDVKLRMESVYQSINLYTMWFRVDGLSKRHTEVFHATDELDAFKQFVTFINYTYPERETS